MIVSALTLDERLRRAQREGKRLAADWPNFKGPYKIIVDCVVSARVTRDLIVDQPCESFLSWGERQPKG